MRSVEIPKRTPDDPPPGTFTQDFNTNFLRTSNSACVRVSTRGKTEFANWPRRRRAPAEWLQFAWGDSLAHTSVAAPVALLCVAHAAEGTVGVWVLSHWDRELREATAAGTSLACWSKEA